MAQATSDEDEDKDGAERHIVYAFALMAAALIQVVGAVTLHVRPISSNFCFRSRSFKSLATGYRIRAH